MSTAGKIFQQIPKVMAEMDAVAKNSKNTTQNFTFRGIDAIYNELHARLAKHAVFTAPEVIEFSREERQTKSGGVMTYTIAKIRFRFYADDGSSFETVMIGEGSDSGDKSANKAMAIAHKYAFLQVFAIPTEDDKDPDGVSHELAPRQGPVARITPIGVSRRDAAPGNGILGSPNDGKWRFPDDSSKRMKTLNDLKPWEHKSYITNIEKRQRAANEPLPSWWAEYISLAEPIIGKWENENEKL